MASVTLRTKPATKKGYSLFLDIYSEGQRYKEYLKLYVSKDYTDPKNKNVLKEDKHNWELAGAIQAKRVIALKESVAGFIPRVNKADFITYYKKQLAVKDHSTYEHALRHLVIFNGSEMLPFKRLTEVYLKDFIDYLKETDLSVTSVRLYLSRLSIVLNMAVQDKIIQVNPFTYLKKGKGGSVPQKQQKKIEYLTLPELRQLNDTPFHARIKEFFMFGCFTGLRESDLLKLKWQDIQGTTLTYSQKKQRNTIMHTLPLSSQALQLLAQIKITQKARMKREDPLVFAHLPGSRAIGWHLKNWAKKAGQKKNIHIHVSRHTYATLALTSGVALYTVSKLLGHSSIAVTQAYAEVIDEVKQQAAELMPVL